jgi:cell division protease FtsH
MSVLLAGRAAEVLIFGQLSTGAADDLDKATDIARTMVMRYGMSEALGPLTYGVDSAQTMLGGPTLARERSYSEQTAREIDCAMENAHTVLAANRERLETEAARLLAKESLTGDELKAVLKIDALAS